MPTVAPCERGPSVAAPSRFECAGVVPGWGGMDPWHSSIVKRLLKSVRDAADADPWVCCSSSSASRGRWGRGPQGKRPLGRTGRRSACSPTLTTHCKLPAAVGLSRNRLSGQSAVRPPSKRCLRSADVQLADWSPTEHMGRRPRLEADGDRIALDGGELRFVAASATVLVPFTSRDSSWTPRSAESASSALEPHERYGWAGKGESRAG